MSHQTRSQQAKSERIDHDLRTRIADGRWPPGHRFTWHGLIAEFGLHFRDVNAVLSPVLKQMRHDGLIEARPRIGLRVTIPGETWNPPPGHEDLPHDQHIEITLRERLRDSLTGEGPYLPGEQFTPLAELAEEFGVSTATVRKATDALKDQGLLVQVGRNRTDVAADLARFTEAELLRPPVRRRPGTSQLAAFGESHTLADWSRHPRCVVPYTTLYSRYEKGWSLEQALTRPLSPSAPARRPTPPVHEVPATPDPYAVARQFILARMSDGSIPPGTVIPPFDVADRTGTLEAVAVEALSDLHDIGMVSHHPSVGYFAATNPSTTSPAAHSTSGDA